MKGDRMVSLYVDRDAHRTLRGREAEVPLLSHTEKVTILLSYRGDLVDSHELFRNQFDGENPRFEVLRAVYPNLERFKKGLGGKIPKTGGGFEEAIVTLLPCSDSLVFIFPPTISPTCSRGGRTSRPGRS